MSSLPPPSLARLLREARLRRGWSQTELAQAIGASQSQISELENGRANVLSLAKVAKAASLLGIDLTPDGWPHEGPAAGDGLVTKICPASDCPSHFPLMVHEALVLRPRPVLGPADRKTRCPECGDVLLAHCGGCGEPVGEGAGCPACGRRYVVPPRLEQPAAAWLEQRLEQLRELRRHTAPLRLPHGVPREAGRPAAAPPPTEQEPAP